MSLSEKTLARIQKEDAAISKRRGYECAYLSDWIFTLVKTGSVEIGWRESCGKTDPTQMDYRHWRKVLPLLKKDGLKISEEPVKHKNAWATKCGGFWNSVIYRIDRTDKEFLTVADQIVGVNKMVATTPTTESQR